MNPKNYIRQFPSIKETQVLTEDMMSEIEACYECQGGSCRSKCALACKPKCLISSKQSETNACNRQVV